MLASHNHTVNYNTNDGYNPPNEGIDYVRSNYIGKQSTQVILNQGSNNTHNHSFSGTSSHNHNITLNLKYINVIVCIKN